MKCVHQKNVQISKYILRMKYLLEEKKQIIKHNFSAFFQHTFENETKTAMALAWAGENDGVSIL